MACSPSEGCCINQEIIQPHLPSTDFTSSLHVSGLSSCAWRSFRIQSPVCNQVNSWYANENENDDSMKEMKEMKEYVVKTMFGSGEGIRKYY